MHLANPALSSRLLGLPERPTLARYLDYWLAHHAWAHLRFSTARTYASVVVHTIAPVLGRTPVSSLSPEKLERAKLVWQRAGVKRSMVRKAVEVLRSALGHAVQLGLCRHNAAARTRIPPKSERPPSWLDVDDARRLLRSAVGTRWEALYALSLGLGLRRGELTGLTWADVDLRAKVLRVRLTRTERRGGTELTAPKTAASRRTVAVPGFVVEALRRQRAREVAKARRAGARVQPADPVFTTRSRRPYWSSQLYQELKFRLVKLGLPRMRYHDLRHTAASLMLAEGVSPRTVMEILGHRNLAVTLMIYGHVNLRHQHAAVALVDRALAGRGSRGRRGRR